MSTRDSAWPAGTPCWTDLSTSDPHAAGEFYRQLFGWDLQVGPPETGGYTIALQDGLAVTAINGMAAEGDTPTVWVTYLATEDVDATVAAAQAAGGTSMFPPMDVMTSGRMGMVVDPTGAAVGLWQAGEMIRSQVNNVPGTVGWNELLTRDVDAAQAFYATVFGFTYDEVPMPPPGRYATFEAGGRMAGGMGSMPDGVPDQVPAHWGVIFNVDDTDAAAAAVQRLGGTLLQPPFDTPQGRLCVAADPQGASFSMMRLTAE